MEYAFSSDTRLGVVRGSIPRESIFFALHLIVMVVVVVVIEVEVGGWA